MTYLAIFDWNGTLFDDFSANFEGANAALAALGKDPISEATYLETFDFPILHFYKRNGINVDDYLEELSYANNAFFPVYEKLAFACPARDGAKELLIWLKERGVQILILSNHIEESIRTNLQRLDLLPYIDHISSNPHDNDIIRKMNKQERLARFMKDHDFMANRSFIIGDSLEEPDIANNLGLLSLSITGGCISEDRLRKKGQDYLIDTLRDVRKILQSEWELEG